MKVQVEIVRDLKESELTFRTPDPADPMIAKIQAILSDDEQLKRILLRTRDTAVVTPIESIIRFFTQDKRVWAESEQGNGKVRHSLRELEEQLQERNFVRINQGELVNIRFIERLNLNVDGGIEVLLRTGHRSYVARRALKAFKKQLGI